MKTKLFMSALLCSVATMVLAAPISEADAQQKASEFINGRNAKTAPIQSKAIIGEEIKFTTAEVCDAFYVFNNETSGGYVIVSADDRMPAVLGYSYSGTYNSDDIPDNMRSWLNGYVEQYEYMLQHDDVSAVSTTSVTGDKIYPLLTSQWSQGYPYNAKCPAINSKSTPTGCVATAMAQIMYYHQWPKKTSRTIPSYTTYTNKIEMPEIDISLIDWDSILPTYSSYGNYSSEQIEAISTLFNLCGTALTVDYDTSGSSASIYSAMRALTEYFEFQEQILSYVSHSDFKSDEWNQLIYDEINSKRPVLYRGSSERSGHAFIIDGYDGDDYFHVNWGWGGYEDNYFLLNSLNGYDFHQSAVVGIENPNTPDGAKYVYATYKDNTLTFYFDNKRDNRQETVYRSTLPSYDYSAYTYITEWREKASSITTVVFDESFSEIKPSSTACWFKDLTELIDIRGIEHLNTQKVTDMSWMFYNCPSLNSIDVSNFNTQNVTNMLGMFYDCRKIKNLDISHFDTHRVTDMRYMFSGCKNLLSLDVSNFETINVTDMASMFSSCSELTTIDVSNFDTHNVTSLGSMFYNCNKLTEIDVSNFDTQNVISMAGMFSECTNLAILNVRNFNTSNVKYMDSMFSHCNKLAEIDVSYFNTQNVTNMDYMFSSCSKLTSLDLSNFHTENVTDMSGMFRACQNLKSLDLSNFNVKKTTEMDYMFYNCDNLKTINVSEKWDTSNVIKSTWMFMFCSNLVGQDGTTYNSSYTDVSKAHYGTGGYLTYKASSAIDTVNSDTNNILPRKFYSLDGKLLSAPHKGLNILRMSDSTTRKVIK
jgi:surface protein